MPTLTASLAQAHPQGAQFDFRCDARVVRRAAAADPEAWATLVARFGPMIHGIARSFRLAPADVDDVVQDTWLRFFRTAERINDPGATAAWLSTTTRREALRVLQRRTREELRADPEPPRDHVVEDALEEIAHRERAAALRGAVRRLPAHQRDIVEALLEEQGASYTDVARRLGLPIGNIGPTRCRALDRLRQDEALVAAVEERPEPIGGRR